jgi:hypothetical protein
MTVEKNDFRMVDIPNFYKQEFHTALTENQHEV